MCENIFVLNLPNKQDDLILGMDIAVSTKVQYLKLKEKNSTNTVDDILLKHKAIILR